LVPCRSYRHGKKRPQAGSFSKNSWFASWSASAQRLLKPWFDWNTQCAGHCVNRERFAMSKVLNIDVIKFVLQRQNELLAMLLLQCCFRALENDKRCLRLLLTYPNPPPTGLTPEQFAARGPFYLFMLVPEVARELERIARWLSDAIERKESWIGRTDKSGRVTRFLRIKTLADALALCEEDEERLRRARVKKHDLAEGNSPRHVSVTRRFEDGSFAVELKTASALRWEGRQMRHCLGNARYASRMRAGVEFFSLRDANGRPHVTLEVVDDRVIQCRGRANSNPFPSYGKKLEWLGAAMGWNWRDLGVTRDPDLLEQFQIDQMLIDGDVMLTDAMLPLARTLHVNGTFKAVGVDSLTTLPSVMKVQGDLILRRCRYLHHMPHRLYVDGNALIEDCRLVRRLATNFFAGGSLVVTKCPQIKLDPSRTVVGGTLVVRRRPRAGNTRANGT
jgi:PcfJ-like protein